MANDDFNQINTDWPLPKFYFRVDLGNGLENVSFQEVSGLDKEAQVIKYRSGNKAAFSDIKMPGIVKYGNVTLKKGIMAKSQHLFDWFSQIKMNLAKRSTVTISLLDERGQPTMIWTLQNAWPTKMTGTDLKSEGNEVAVETIEIAHEGLSIKNA